MSDESNIAIAERLNQVQRRIAEACERAKRDSKSVRLLAVTKTVSAERVAEAVSAGQKWLGENYVQEAVTKAQALAALQPSFHLIGNLQRNKVKLAVGLFDLIHTVDRFELAREISKVAAVRGINQQVLIQVNISSEESKSGVAPERTLELAREVSELPSISLRGLMCIGSYVEEAAPEAERRREFVELRLLRDRVAGELGIALPELSMGMSHDYDVAVEEGATIVRVGSAIFGARS